MRIGFTGTRKGMTEQQKSYLVKILSTNLDELEPTNNVFIHGGCEGADAEAAMIAGNIGYQLWCLPSPIHYPPKGPTNFVTLSPCEPLKRNAFIVGLCQMLVATPKTANEERRSGTWATICYAHAHERDTVIIWPSGSTERN